MAVRWPDGSYTGSVRVELLAPAPEPKPEKTTPESDKGSDDKRGVK